MIIESFLRVSSSHYINAKPSNNAEIYGDASVRYALRLVAGKGGFGSMLRAIGAQIEKTTNREACRDLSGRRLRDIREEQRLREWAAQQAQREEEARQRKEEKLKKLLTTPKFEFRDEAYEKACKKTEESIDDAVEKGFQAASASVSKPVKRKAAKLWIDDDLSASESDDENRANGTSEKNSEESDKSVNDTNVSPNKRARLSEIDTLVA